MRRRSPAAAARCSAAGAAVRRPGAEPYASQALRTIPPRENGGNLDVAPGDARAAGCCCPSTCRARCCRVGDVHFAQGEGEVCGTAIEVGRHARRSTCRLRPAETLRWRRASRPSSTSRQPAPRAARVVRDDWASRSTDDGENADMDVTARRAARAARGARGWLEAERGLTREQGYVLASVAADLRIAEARQRAQRAGHLPAAARRVRGRPAVQAVARSAAARIAVAPRSRVSPSAEVGRARVGVGGARVHSPLDGAPRRPRCSPRNSSIKATERISAIGLAMPRPAMSGAEPWIAWNRLGLRARRVEVGARPDPQAAGARPRSGRVRMSPNRLLATITSSDAGWLTTRATRASISTLSCSISGYSAATCADDLVPERHRVTQRVGLRGAGHAPAPVRARVLERVADRCARCPRG